MWARIVSAIALGAAAVLASVLIVGAAQGRAMLAFGASAALVGFLAGRHIGTASGAGAAALLGVEVTVASAVVCVLGVSAVGYAVDIAAGPPDTGLEEVLLPELWAAVLGGALMLSPLGALGAAVAWWWVRRTAPVEPS